MVLVVLAVVVLFLVVVVVVMESVVVVFFCGFGSCGVFSGFGGGCGEGSRSGSNGRRRCAHIVVLKRK